MFRWLTVILLVATLVACPFRCGGAFGEICAAEIAGESANQPTTCGCGCCSQERPASPENEPDSPLPEPCDCGSCVCEGAVLVSLEFAPGVDEGAGIVLFEMSPPALVRVQVARSHDLSNELDPSGRTLRVLRQSFQI